MKLFKAVRDDNVEITFSVLTAEDFQVQQGLESSYPIESSPYVIPAGLNLIPARPNATPAFINVVSSYCQVLNESDIVNHTFTFDDTHTIQFSWVGSGATFTYSGGSKQVNFTAYCTLPYCDDGIKQLARSYKDPFGTLEINWYGSEPDYPRIHASNNLNVIPVINESSGTSNFIYNFWLGVEPYNPPTDPYYGLGENDIPGGGSVGIPGFPELTATTTGIIGLFAPSAAQMKQLADYMWTDFGGTGQDTVEVLKEIVEAIKRTISNPLDYVIGLNIIPSQGLSIGGSSVIKFGFTSSGVSMPRLSNQYFTVDCGSITFSAVCGDTFLDYAPYSKFSIYLPYIGVKAVDANDFVGHTIGVIYHGDTVTGGVTAYITKDGSVMYQYSGCCALNIPLSADNWGNTISGAVQIATSLVVAGATGGAAGVGIAAAKGAASVAANPSLLSPQVAHSGAVSGGAGCMAVQYPFVIREAVRFHSTEGFNKFSGYPAYYARSLGEVSGFTTVLEVHLENVPATNGEIAEIENLLKSGVIL